MRFPVSQPSLTGAELSAVVERLQCSWLTMGPKVEEFEQRFAERLGVRHAVMCNSGTSALHLALLALGVGPGDQILVPDLTFIATSNAVQYCGAEPVYCDVDSRTWCIDVRDAASKMGPRVKGIIPVHLYGVPCEMSELMAFAKSSALFVVEDTAEGLGGEYGGKPLGTFGDVGTFSFFGNKVLTTGEGGCCVTDNSTLAKRMVLYRGQGMSPRRYEHEVVGFNYRMTDVAAAVGVEQLKRLDEMLEKRREIFTIYRSKLRGLLEFTEVDGTAPWLFTALLPVGVNRGKVMHALQVCGVETRPTFVPLHQQPCYRPWGDISSLKNSSRIGARGISLPTYVGLTRSEVVEIATLVADVVRGAKYVG